MIVDTRCALAPVAPGEPNDYRPARSRAQGCLLRCLLDRAEEPALLSLARAAYPLARAARSHDSGWSSSQCSYTRFVYRLMQLDGSQTGFDLPTHGLVPLWDAKRFAKTLDRLIDKKARVIRCHLEQHSTGL